MNPEPTEHTGSLEPQHPKGTLYLVATPIGNLEDISLRALRLLKEVDLIACEDTRHTARILHHFGIKTPCESFHEHNETQRSAQVLAQLAGGKTVALVSDAGSPLVSDPGYNLVSACRAEGIRVVPVPGASAAITALTASGLATDRFYFGGFLPHKKSARRARLQEASTVNATLVFYEAPHRLLASLEDMIEILGDRQACLARELTKIYEEFLCARLAIIHGEMKSRPQVRGEITLVIDRDGPKPAAGTLEWPASISAHLEQEMQKTGASKKEALKTIARRRGISRRDAYQQLLREK
jgi:16S rRNA (cytidine1402-2'-O)-methyltransferase